VAENKSNICSACQATERVTFYFLPSAPGYYEMLTLHFETSSRIFASDMSTFQSVIFFVACINTFPGVGSSVIMGLDNVINQYSKCFNIVHFCDVNGSRFLGTKVPVYLLTRFLNISNLPNTKHLSCVIKFVLFPERLPGRYFKFDIHRGIKSRLQTRHFFTTRGDADMTGQLSARVSTGNIVIHLLRSESRTPEIFQTLVTVLYFVSKNYRGVVRLSGADISLEREIENKSRLIRRSGVPNDRRYNGTEFISVASLMNSKFGNPFKFENKIRMSWEAGLETTIFDFKQICWMLSMEAQGIWLPPNMAGVDSTHLLYNIYNEAKYHVSEFSKEELAEAQRDLLVITGTTSTNFATCDGVVQKVSFQFYVNPYDQTCWIIYLSTVLFILPLFVVLIQHQDLSKAAYAQLYTHIAEFCVFNAMDICPDIPDKYKMHFKRETILILGLWLVANVTLGNAYKGIVTSDLTAPYFITSKWTNVSETPGFLYVAGRELANTLWEHVQYRKLASNQNEFLANPIRGCTCFSEDEDFIHELCRASWHDNYLDPWNLSRCPEIRKEFNQRDVHLPQKSEVYCAGAEAVLIEHKNVSNYGMEYPRFKSDLRWSYLGRLAVSFCRTFVYFDNSNGSSMKGIRHQFPFLNSILEEIPTFVEYGRKDKIDLKTQFSMVSDQTSTCNRTAYLNTDSKLDAFLAHSEMTSRIVYRKGKETLLPFWDGFLFKESSWYSGMQTLMASGIYNIWEKWYNLQYPTEEHQIIKNYTKLMAKNSRVTKLTMQTNIWSVFLIYFTLIHFCFIAFIAEFPIKYWSKCLKGMIAFRIRIHLTVEYSHHFFTERWAHLSQFSRKLIHRVHISIHYTLNKKIPRKFRLNLDLEY